MGIIIVGLLAIFWFVAGVWGTWSVTFFLTDNDLISSLVAFLMAVLMLGAFSEDNY